MKKVSIIIPCFNAEKHLAETLDSALRQSWPDIEILAVDDGSTDRTWDILNAYASDRVKPIRQSNSGPSAARNAGLAQATGDYIQYLDSDDLMSPDKIEEQVRQLEGCGEGVISFCKWSHFWKAGAVDAAFPEYERYHDYAEPVDMLLAMLRDNWCLSIHCWLIPRQVADKAGPWDTQIEINDDFDYFTRVLCACDSVRYCPRGVVYYRKGVPTSLTARAVTGADIDSMLARLMSQESLILARADSPRAREALALGYYTFIYQFHGLAPGAAALAREHVVNLGVKPPRAMGGRAMRALMRLFGFWTAVRLRSACMLKKGTLSH